MKKILLQVSAFLFSATSFAQSTLENLGEKVNTKYSEARPVISADGNTLYFLVEGNPANPMFSKDKYAQDIWYATLDAEGKWTQATQAGAPLNGLKDNAVFWASPDGNRLLIRGAYENGNYVGRGFSLCNKTNDGWTAPQKLNIKNYNRMAVDRYSGASMANDGKTLFLYFSEEVNSNLNDIYISRYNQDIDEWSSPEKLPADVNLDDFDEITPSLASDGATLYFASNRPGGFGGYDIWMTKRNDDSWKSWSTPVNMGSTINTPKFDAYFSVDAKGEYGYLTTTQNSLGSTDIARVKLSEDQRPKTVVMVYGKVYNAATKKEMDAAQLFYDAIPGETSEGNAIASPGGSYKVTLQYGKKYSIRASADKYLSIIDTLDLTQGGVYREIHRDLYLSPVYENGNVLLDSNGNPIRNNIDEADSLSLEPGQILTVNNLLFEFSKSILRADAYKELDKVVKMLKLNPNMQVELSAHTDAIGGYSSNLKLSNDRANASKEYIISKGIDSKRITAKGYGETTPVDDNKTEEGRQKNRRVEVRILKN